MSGDNPYRASPGDTPGAADSGHGATQARSAETGLAEAPAEPMSRAEYAAYMRHGPTTGSDDPGSAGAADHRNIGGDDDPARTGQPGDAGDQPHGGDPAVQAQGMTRSEYAEYMRLSPAASDDGPGMADAGDHAAPDADANAGRVPGTGQATTGIGTAGHSAESVATGDDAGPGQPEATDGEVDPGSCDANRPDVPDGASDAADPGAQAEAEHDTPGESLEKGRPGHPDIHGRYPSDYKPAKDAPPPRIDGPHDSPEKWLDTINPDKADDGRSVNCGDCSRSVDGTWHGFPAIAAAIDYPRLQGELPSRMTEWAGVPPKTASMADINQRLDDLGPGSSAVVGCDWKTGGGHWFNAVNDGGTVKAVDGQSGKVEAWPPTRKGLGYDESRMRYSDAIYFNPDGKVV
jgi:hypothetical protein